MMKTYPIFTYAKLKKHDLPDNTVARGVLHLLPNGDGAADFSGDGIIRGQLLHVDHKELRRIDHEELPEYERRRILADGKPAWGYELKDHKVMEQAPVIDGGRWLPHMKD
jgi:gamma-glutamylcyclotransferase (GGCT)/AIG2-like uncharacterized protein YtfP